MSHTISLLGCLFFVCSLTSCGDSSPAQSSPTAVQVFDVEKEEKEIIALLNRETAAFENKDADALLACYISDGRFSRIQQLPDGGGMLKEGGELESMRGGLMTYFESLGDEVFVLEKLSGLEISFSTDNTVATVTYTQFAQMGGVSRGSDQIRTMEKENGEWKILLISSIMH